MKRIWIGLCSLLLVQVCEAQAKKKNAGTNRGNQVTGKTSPVIRLNSVSENEARMTMMQDNTAAISISDPFIQTLNTRAKGYNPGVKNVEILGMPKGAYGFAQGRLRVFPSGTTSSGTLTGTGTVATGSHPGVMGSMGIGMGANGKSPFAGTGMWGNNRGLEIKKADSTIRRTGY